MKLEAIIWSVRNQMQRTLDWFRSNR